MIEGQVNALALEVKLWVYACGLEVCLTGLAVPEETLNGHVHYSNAWPCSMHPHGHPSYSRHGIDAQCP